MSQHLQQSIAAAGVFFAVGGMFLALWLYWRGGGRRTKIRVSVNRASGREVKSILNENSDVVDCQIFRLKIRNAGPRDTQVLDPVNRELEHLRPHVDLPPSVYVKYWSRLREPAAFSDPDRHVPIAKHPGRLTRMGERQKLYIHVHRLRARSESTIYLCLRSLQCGDNQLYGGPPWSFLLFRGWIQDVTVAQAGDGFGVCSGEDLLKSATTTLVKHGGAGALIEAG